MKENLEDITANIFIAIYDVSDVGQKVVCPKNANALQEKAC